jgi:TPR repeat protein
MRFFVLSLLALLFVAPARADEAKLSAALSAFEQLTLWRDSTGAAGGVLEATGQIRRWDQPLRVRVVGRSSSSERSIVLRSLTEAAEIAGLQIEMLEGEGTDENFRISFFPENAAPPRMQSAGCATFYSWTGSGRLTRADLDIRSGSRGFSRCVNHEMLHAFGFPGHPHALDSVMSYSSSGKTEWTAIDRYLLKVLYKARFVPGAFHLPAMVAARQYIAEDMGLVAAGGESAHLARPVMDRAVAQLRDHAAGPGRNAPAIAAQLGNAYFFGHYVAVDRAEAVRFWRVAADKENADARFRLGSAARDGEGMARDDAEAARWLGLAAAQNHNAAMLALGRMLRDGRGRAADPVEAHAWLSLAAERNAQGAAADRDALAARLSPDQVAASRRRAAELAPRPAAR